MQNIKYENGLQVSLIWIVKTLSLIIYRQPIRGRLFYCKFSPDISSSQESYFSLTILPSNIFWLFLPRIVFLGSFIILSRNAQFSARTAQRRIIRGGIDLTKKTLGKNVWCRVAFKKNCEGKNRHVSILPLMRVIFR
jgi:hypothetical protein